jgi:hypothetical protein
MSKSVGVLERQVAFSQMNIKAENEELPEKLKTVKTPVAELGMCRAGEPAGPLTHKGPPVGCDFKQLVQHTGQNFEVVLLKNS